MRRLLFIVVSVFIILSVNAQTILPGAFQTHQYLPLLKGKRVGVFANQTSMIGTTHVVDSLQQLGINIVMIFGPEHGFRGTADAGEKLDSYIDKATGIPVVSLYGSKRKPSKEDMAKIDVLLFDIQDVGVRFYTFISSLQEYLETAVEFNKPLVILDRPNPNGFYVDGPVLDTTFRSFVGMQSVPIVYGMTLGEYSTMLLKEGWLIKSANTAYKKILTTKYKSNDAHFELHVVKNKNYTHKSKYELPIKPSPNLPYASSIYWYPSTCFFEGTILSEGRGTPRPFEIFGHPSLPKTMYAFTPVGTDGAKNPKLKDQLCYGWNVSGTSAEVLKKTGDKIQLKYLLEAYRLFPEKEKFFITSKKENIKPTDYFFNKLSGNSELMQQIKDGVSENDIRKSWEPKLNVFKQIRKKYLLYAE